MNETLGITIRLAYLYGRLIGKCSYEGKGRFDCAVGQRGGVIANGNSLYGRGFHSALALIYCLWR